MFDFSANDKQMASLNAAKNNADIVRRLSTIAMLFLSSFASVQALAAETALTFNRDIRPILSENCYQCHGPDKDRKAGLRLDDREAAIDFGALEPGDADSSYMLDRIESDDPDEVMPPPWSKKPPLTDEQKQRLRDWINAGAEYEAHWSFTPRDFDAEVPPNSSVAKGAKQIDRFVQDRLRSEGLTPTQRASRERLLRRVTFDLTGLPPTTEELEAFLNDRSADAYEKVVDRLLASPRYGERMASDWLDVARYSDSYGYQVDRDRFVWPWRDWLVRTFNNNMPYDQFITEQLAGDLLPNATDEQILATTFNRLHPQKVEGGSVPEEFRVEYFADRAQTAATAFLGLTLECCRCHDHKFDPLTQKEYYQLTAFFDNIDEAGLYAFFTESIPTPTLLLPTDDEKEQLELRESKIKQARETVHKTREQQREAFVIWAKKQIEASPAEELKTSTVRENAEASRVGYLDFAESTEQKIEPNEPVEGVQGQGVRLTGDDGIKVDAGNFRRSQPFSVALWMQTPDVKERAVVFHRSRSWTDAGSRGYQLLIEEGKLSASLIHFWPGNAIRIKTVDKIPTQEWIHVTMAYDGSSKAAGLTLYINGEPAECEVVRDNLFKNITGGGNDFITIGERHRDRGFKQGLVDEFQVFDRQLTQPEIRSMVYTGIGVTGSVSKQLASFDLESSNAQTEAWFEYYLANHSEPYQQALNTLQAEREASNTIADNVSEIMVMRELPEPRKSHLLERGVYDAKGEEVFADTPAFLPELPEGAPQNRLGLAQWLTDPENPLTSRVAINRLWQMIFGRGLVGTPEDFGSQGQLPTHPELLDWLAEDFIQSGWNLKRMLKQLVMTEIYQQDSQATPEVMQQDPENLLLARGPSAPLTAEMIRDNALAASGLLDPTIGGRPAKPYEVAVSFKPVEKDKGVGLYRRSLYTYWKRTAPAPVMMLMDASGRDVCRVKRERTSSPLQAMVLMNGTQFVEAARVLSERLINEHGDNTAEALQEMFQTLTGRTPDEAETVILTNLYQDQLERFEEDPSAAEKLLQIGDAPMPADLEKKSLAATTIVAQALMNYDETVMKR